LVSLMEIVAHVFPLCPRTFSHCSCRWWTISTVPPVSHRALFYSQYMIDMK
jgi:hypothetical protein